MLGVRGYWRMFIGLALLGVVIWVAECNVPPAHDAACWYAKSKAEEWMIGGC